MPVAANHAAEIPALVVLGRPRGLRERSGPHQLAVERQVRPSQRSLLRSGHVLPSTPGEKAVIAARDQLRAVLEQRAIGGLADHPVVDHLGPHVSPVLAASHRPVDLIPRLQMTDLPGPAGGQQDRGVAPYAVNARMRATPIWVHRPFERDARFRRHAVERALGPDLVETRLERLGRVEAADHSGARVAGQPGLLIRLHRLSVPAHEHMFARRADGRATARAPAG